jgi:hypothetical protein
MYLPIRIVGILREAKRYCGGATMVSYPQPSNRTSKRGLGLKSMSTACTRPVNGPRVSALWVALFVMCQYSLIAYAQNGRSSAGSSPTLEEGNGSEVPGELMPKWRRAGEDHGLKFSLQDTYDFQGNPTGGRLV